MTCNPFRRLWVTRSKLMNHPIEIRGESHSHVMVREVLAGSSVGHLRHFIAAMRHALAAPAISLSSGAKSVGIFGSGIPTGYQGY